MIKLIKKQQGLPFLLALGVMFILSSSFLAVQLWSDEDGLRGAAAALEAPLIPPDLNAPTIVPPPVEKPEPSVVKKEKQAPVSDVATEEKAKQENKPVVVAPAEVVVEAPVKLEKPEEAELKPVAEEKVVVAKKPERKKAEPKKIEKADEISVSVKSNNAVPKKDEVVQQPERQKTTSKPVVKKVEKDESIAFASERKELEKAVVESPKLIKKPVKKAEIPTEIPPEWNWFQTPLKLEVADGKVEIVPVAKVESGSAADLKTVVAQAKPIKMAPEAKKVVVSTSKAKRVMVGANTQKPFAKALGKMAKLREKRSGVAVRKTSVRPEVVRPATTALKRLQDMLQLICKDGMEPSDDENFSYVESMENSPAFEEAEPENERPVETAEFDSYRGSGSSFSMRVNELIRSGEWLKD